LQWNRGVKVVFVLLPNSLLVGTLIVITELFRPEQIRIDIARSRVHLAEFLWDVTLRPVEPQWATWLRALRMAAIFAIAYVFAFIIDRFLIQPFARLAESLGPSGAKYGASA
jgi:hypothetical protein